MGHSRKTLMKAAILVVLLSITIPTLLFKNSIDEFAPKHMALIDEIGKTGHLGDEYITGLAPGFYSYGVVVSDVADIPGSQLLYLPVLVIPYAIMSFLFVFSFYRNFVLAALVCFVEMSSGIAGTSRTAFWMNALGNMMLYMIVIGLLLDTRRPRCAARFTFSLLVIGISLVYTSYDFAGMTIIMLFSMIGVLVYNRLRNRLNFIQRKAVAHLMMLAAVITIVELTLSDFVYGTFVPTIVSSSELELGGIDKFLSAYLFHRSVSSPVSDILLRFPPSISMISIVKYGALLLGILACLVGIRQASRIRGAMNSAEIMIISIVIMVIIYSIPRLYIGSITVTYAFLPGILSVAWLWNQPGRRRRMAFVIAAVLVVTTPIYYYENASNNLINDDPLRYSDIKTVSAWYYGNMRGTQLASDELSKNLLTLNLVENRDDFTFAESHDSFKILSLDDVEFMMSRSSNQPATGYILVNYRLNTVSLQNWVALKAWSSSEATINDNSHLDKVLDVGLIGVYALP